MDNDTQLFLQNAKYGNIDAVQVVLKQAPGLDINIKLHPGGHTALMLAAQNGHFEMVRFLLSKGSTITEEDAHGNTAFMLAAEQGHGNILPLLAHHDGFLINKKNIEGLSALLLAAAHGRSEAIEILLQMPEIDINLKDNQNDTALTHASFWGHLSVVKKLTRAQADLFVTNIHGDNALVAAKRNNHTDIVIHLITCIPKEIIQTISPPQLSLRLAFLEAQEAIKEFEFKTFRRLFQIDKNNSATKQPLPEGLMIRVFSFLTPKWFREETFPQMYKRQKNKIGKVAAKIALNQQLLLAAQQQTALEVQGLLEDGARVDYKKDGKTALKYALEREDASLGPLRTLAKSNHPYHIQQEFELALGQKNIAILKKLILTGAIDEKEMLRFAIEQNRIDELKTLIRAGVELTDLNHEGNSAIKIALKTKRYKIVAFLLMQRAKALYSEFKKQPSYYVFSAALRLAVGALVGYGVFYGLTAAAVYPSVSFFFPKVISGGIGLLSGAWAFFKIGSVLLSRIFGEVKVFSGVNRFVRAHEYTNEYSVYYNLKITKGLLNFFGYNKPYVTPVSQMEKELENHFKNTFGFQYNPEKANNLAHAHTRAFVNNPEYSPLFDSEAKAEVNAEPYVSATLNNTPPTVKKP